ncbi:DNA-methyltransferase [Parasphingorhabdus sp. DH2-15]|uniref:DNA-methyltransferase n=1 Tax=Parasphingorhabdus sp. DH2-15 TaxID=3444112 RepID=UPI003F689619
MTKKRAPRNRTLIVEDHEADDLLSEAIQLDQPSAVSEILNKIIHQDIENCIELVPENSIDLLVLDPPYNLDKKFGSTKFRSSSADQYSKLFENWIRLLKRCLKDTATIYVCSDWKTSNIIYPILEREFVVRNRITWEREKGRGAKSNWKNCSEDIWFCTVSDDYHFDVDSVKLKKKVIAPYKDSAGVPKDWNESKSGNFRLTFPSNLWSDISIPFWSMPENTDHPTQKPEKLIAKLILASSKEKDLVFDPFLGSGTTAVVAKKLGRHFLGIEREKYYCQLAIKRLRRAENDTAIQGYHDGVFWERNSLALQIKSKLKMDDPVSAKADGDLFAKI